MVVSKDLQHLLSDEAKSRKSSPLKAIFKYRSMPGMRSLGGGLPIPELFPFENMHFESLAPPYKDGVDLADYSGLDLIDVHIDRSIGKGTQNDVELSTSLQYGMSHGEPRIKNFIKEHTEIVHKIPYEDWDLMVSIGNTFTWDAMVRTFTNRGDVILFEQFTFTSALETANANGCIQVGVRMDLEGIIPEALEEQMAQWKGPRPKMLYTIPTGQNPTGSCLSAERRKQIYKIAQKYDFLIIEDEPYYYLQFPTYVKGNSSESRSAAEFSSNDALLSNLVPSFLEFDVEGRVLRLDSFSKVIAPGSRLSWIIGQERFIERLVKLQECTAQTPSGFSVSAVYGVLRRWGHDGYLQWLNKLMAVYSRARDVACDAIYEYFPKGKYEFQPPVAGMFYWVKVDARRYRGFKRLNEDPAACELELFEKAINNKILLVPGDWFAAKSQTDPPQIEFPKTNNEKHAIYFRGTFAGVTHETLRTALRDFGKLLDEELTEEV